MDPVSLASTVTAILIPYISKIGGNIAEDAGKGLWNLIIDNFKDKPAASATAGEFASKVEDSENQEAFKAQLRKALRDSPEFQKELSVFVQQILETSEKAGVDQSVRIGNSNASDNSGVTIVVGRSHIVSPAAGTPTGIERQKKSKKRK